jgi:hypothetical protein
MSWLSQRLTPPKSVQKSISNNDIYKGVQNIGGAVGIKDVSMAHPLGGSGSVPNQLADKGKDVVNTVGNAVGGVAGAFNPMDMFGAGGIGGLMDKIWARQDKQKAEDDKQPLQGLGLTQSLDTPDRYSDSAQQAAIDRRYQGMSSLAKGQQNAASVGEQNALSRRLAAMGALNSGAGMKMLSQQQNLAARRAADQNTQLSLAQSQEKQASMDNIQKMNETSRQFDTEFKLNERIADANLKMADKIAKSNDRGLITSMFDSIFGTGMNMKSVFGQ